MKMINKIALSLAVTSTILLTGNNGVAQASGLKSEKKLISEESLGLRKTDLYSENSKTVGEKTNYGKKPAGASKEFNRAYQDAPPMIPHDIEGMLPITINNNQCITCHVDSAPYDKTIPSVPVSHMIDFRPKTSIARDGKITKNGKEIDNTSSEELKNVSIKKEGKLIGARFNCSQCHAPQSQDKPLVKNNFKANYTTKDGMHKSHWNGKKFMEGINTTK